MGALVGIVAAVGALPSTTAEPGASPRLSIEVARELGPSPSPTSSLLPKEAYRFTLSSREEAGPAGIPRKASVAEQLGGRITGIRVTWYDTNRVESAAEAEAVVRAWWEEPTLPIMNRFPWANNFTGPGLVYAEVREDDGSVGRLVIEHSFPSVRAAWRDGAGRWRFTHHGGNRRFLLSRQQPERILAQLASADDAVLESLLYELATVGEGDERVGRGIQPYLVHPEVRIRRAALTAMAAAQQPTHLVFEALMGALVDPEPELRRTVLGLIRHGPRGHSPVDPRFLPAVLTNLGHEDSSVREAACAVAGRLGREGTPEVAHQVVDSLQPLLLDPQADVRAAAATALGELRENGREALRILSALRPDPEEKVRGAVESALRGLREVHERRVEGVDVIFGVPIYKISTNTGTLDAR